VKTGKIFSERNQKNLQKRKSQKMKLKVEIDHQIEDKIIQESLKWHITVVSEDLKKLKRLRKPSKPQKHDIGYFNKLLPALKIVGDFYGVK
jgi:hypothetical protein